MKLKASPQQADILVGVAAARLKARKKQADDLKPELERCQHDVGYFIDTYCQTYDPRPEAKPNHLPFKLYPYQRRLVQDLEASFWAGEPLFLEKSRDMGVSWTVLAWLMWHWRFDDAFQALVGSRKEDIVDNDEADSLFWKLEYLVEHWPEWLKPKGYTPRKHRRYMKLDNPESDNSIVGESANQDFSRAGRYSVVLLDEFQSWQWARSAWTAVPDASPCRIVVCTAKPGTFAKRVREQQEGQIKVKTIHWQEHPKKDGGWYRKQQNERSSEDLAQEVDINWSGTVRGLVYPGWQGLKRGRYPYVPGWPLYVSWDWGVDNAMAISWWQQDPRSKLWRPIDAYSNHDHGIDWYVPFVTGQLESGERYAYSERDLEKIEAHRGWPMGKHVGDPAGKQRNPVTGTSVIDQLRVHGIHVNTRPDVNTFEARKNATELFIRRIEGINLPECAGLDDAVSNARYPERREGSQATSEVTKPIHDWTADYRVTVEYMAVNEPKQQKAIAKPAERIIPSWEKYCR